MHCHALKRFCEPCARGYLQMEKLPSARIVSRKCPYCPAKADPRTLTHDDDAYEKDFAVMVQDTELRACVYEPCPYRGPHVELNRHLQRCLFQPQVCEGCSERVAHIDEDSHRQRCPGYTRCHACKQSILINNYATHLLQRHSLRRCDDCDATLPMNEMDCHECPERRVMCDLCDEFFVHRERTDHLLAHLQFYHDQEIEMLQDLAQLRERTRRVQDRILS